MGLLSWSIYWIFIFIFFIAVRFAAMKINDKACIIDVILHTCKRNIITTFLVLLLAFAMCLIFYFANKMNVATHFNSLGTASSLDESGNINIVYQYASSIGGLLAALFAGASIFLLWVTLSEQRKQNERQSIENHFYKMLGIVRANSNLINSKGKKGREVFLTINKEFNTIYKALETINLSNIKKIQISWLIVFYGLDLQMRETLFKEFQLITDSNDIEQLFKKDMTFNVPELTTLEKEYNSTKEQNEANILANQQYKNKWLSHDGYQSILAHYYRHLYQIITFINEKALLSYEEKYGYIKTLRAQLNIFELILLFYNTLSPYGKTWEYAALYANDQSIKTYDKYKEYLSELKDNEINKIEKDHTDKHYKEYLKDKKNKELDINNQLITKYQFFRNATMPLMDGKIKISSFYPMINYENALEVSNGITEQEFNKLKKEYT